MKAYELTCAEYKRISDLNARNDWGLSHAQLSRLITKHERARILNDLRAMALLEDRLTDCNFHTECGLLIDGNYRAARATADKIYKED